MSLVSENVFSAVFDDDAMVVVEDEVAAHVVRHTDRYAHIDKADSFDMVRILMITDDGYST